MSREPNNAPERYEVGMVSLAREVLKDGIRSGEKHLEKSVWAQFLYWYHKQYKTGWGCHEGTLLEPEGRNNDADEN